MGMRAEKERERGRGRESAAQLFGAPGGLPLSHSRSPPTAATPPTQTNAKRKKEINVCACVTTHSHKRETNTHTERTASTHTHTHRHSTRTIVFWLCPVLVRRIPRILLRTTMPNPRPQIQ